MSAYRQRTTGLRQLSSVLALSIWVRRTWLLRIYRRSKMPASGLAFPPTTLTELDIALSAEPDYVALGPVFETKLKKMKWAPLGLVSRVRMEAADRPPCPSLRSDGITPASAPGCPCGRG